MAPGSASLVGLIVVAVLTVSSFAESESQVIFATDYVVKTNATGLCNATNDYCDWNVGVWTAIYHYALYSCNGESTLPSEQSDLCCTTPYRVPVVCVNGYRKDDGALVQACVFQESRFNNVTGGVSDQRTLVVNSVHVVTSFEDGINVDGSCTPFRQLTYDTYVASATPAGIRDVVSCPEFPVGEAYCDASSLGVSNFVKARRRIPAARDAGYRIYKSFNSQGTCSLGNGNCDWAVGSWVGYAVAQAFSASYIQGLTDIYYPITPQDVRCAKQPFTVPARCDVGYSTLTGNLALYCQAGSARIIPVNSSLGNARGVINTKEYNQYAEIVSLRNGFNLQYPNGLSGCAPMERYDSDTTISNILPVFPYTDCTENNVSPDLNVRCVEDGVNSVHMAYLVLIRTYGSGGPAAYASIAQKAQDTVFLFSSGSTLVGSLSAVVISFLLLWE